MRRGIALALLVSGCGLVQTRGPDANRAPDRRPECTESFDASKRDSIGAVAGFFTIVAGMLFYKVGDNADTGVPLIVGGAVMMAGSYVSGGVGYYRVKACRKAIAEFEQRTRDVGSAP